MLADEAAAMAVVHGAPPVAWSKPLLGGAVVDR
jgi:hypothetical protein